MSGPSALPASDDETGPPPNKEVTVVGKASRTPRPVGRANSRASGRSSSRERKKGEHVQGEERIGVVRGKRKRRSRSKSVDLAGAKTGTGGCESFGGTAQPAMRHSKVSPSPATDHRPGDPGIRSAVVAYDAQESAELAGLGAGLQPAQRATNASQYVRVADITQQLLPSAAPELRWYALHHSDCCAPATRGRVYAQCPG